MSTAIFSIIVLVALALVVGAYLYGVRKGVLQRQMRVTEAWEALTYAMRNRARLTQPLIDEVQKVTTFEQDIFDAAETSANQLLSVKYPSDVSEADRASHEAMADLYRISDYYPPITDSHEYLDLHAQMDDSENAVQQARKNYNRDARDLNAKLTETAARAFARRLGIRPVKLIDDSQPKVTKPQTAPVASQALKQPSQGQKQSVSHFVARPN